MCCKCIAEIREKKDRCTYVICLRWGRIGLIFAAQNHWGIYLLNSGSNRKYHYLNSLKFHRASQGNDTGRNHTKHLSTNVSQYIQAYRFNVSHQNVDPIMIRESRWASVLDFQIWCRMLYISQLLLFQNIYAKKLPLQQSLCHKRTEFWNQCVY